MAGNYVQLVMQLNHKHDIAKNNAELWMQVEVYVSIAHKTSNA